MLCKDCGERITGPYERVGALCYHMKCPRQEQTRGLRARSGPALRAYRIFWRSGGTPLLRCASERGKHAGARREVDRIKTLAEAASVASLSDGFPHLREKA
jgi:hypothetical protein